MILLTATAVLVTALAMAQIKPVESWPKTISTSDGITYNATEKDCIKAGYRLMPAKPKTPLGKQIKSETLVQDDKSATAAKWAIVYEDAPVVEPPVYAPEVLTNIPTSQVTFVFTTNGEFRAAIWKDLQAITNKAVTK
jgi:hypothetical protein